jgi:AcrR family transcriptional regulator
MALFLTFNSNKCLIYSHSDMNLPVPHSSLRIATEAATALRLLDAAEQLLATHGMDGTSVRMITAHARANIASVTYHFGSKEGLIQAVFRRRLDSLNAERLRTLDALEKSAQGAPIKPSKIVDAFFGTLLRMGQNPDQGGPVFLQLLGRTMTEPSKFIDTLLAQEHEAVIKRFKRALIQSLPQVPKAEIVWRFHFMLGATAYAIAGADQLALIAGLRTKASADQQIEQLQARLMSFLLGGLRAPLPLHSSSERGS